MMLTFLSLLILAQAPQGWQENARMEDEVYYFYTGVSSPLENKRKAREEAVNQARSAFLIEHFGLHMKIDERVISNLNQQSVTQDLSIRTPEHFLVGEKIESLKRKKDITYVLLSYPKKEVEKQKRILASSIRPSDESPKRSETIRSGEAELIVDTKPQGALVYLNGSPIGTTPLHAKGLEEGAIDLELVLPLHKSVRRELILHKGSPLKLEEKIEPEIGVLHLAIEPKSAELEIKSIFKGRAESLKDLKVPAGEHRIIVRHEDYESVEQSIFVSPGSETYRLIELTPKPEKLSFVSNQYPFEANFKGRNQETKTLEIENNQAYLIDPMFDKLIARKNGFKNFEVELELRPNVSTGVNVTFIPGESQPVSPSNARSSRSIVRNPWFWGGIIAAGILTGVLATSLGGGGGGGDDSSVTSSGPTENSGSGSGGVKINIK